jgi:putative signal transducing protein
MADDYVVVRRFTTEVEAELARAILESNGIAAAVLRDDAGGMLPAMSVLSAVRLVVATADAEVAREVLDAGDG